MIDRSRPLLNEVREDIPETARVLAVTLCNIGLYPCPVLFLADARFWMTDAKEGLRQAVCASLISNFLTRG